MYLDYNILIDTKIMIDIVRMFSFQVHTQLQTILSLRSVNECFLPRMQIHEYELIYRFNLYKRNMQTMKYSPAFMDRYSCMKFWKIGQTSLAQNLMTISECVSFSNTSYIYIDLYTTRKYPINEFEVVCIVSHSSGAECCVSFTLYLYLSN